jgi:preprotein translocase SecE subunit
MNPLEATTGYFRGAVSELKQVRWPTRNQAIRLSIITIIFTFATSAAYGVVDFSLGRIVALLLHIA